MKRAYAYDEKKKELQCYIGLDLMFNFLIKNTIFLQKDQSK